MDYFLDSVSDGFLAIFVILVIVMLVMLIICSIFYIIGRWHLFKKAGKNGWEAIVPFYNDWVYVEIAGLNYWWYFFVIASLIFAFIPNEYITGIASLVSLFGLFVCNFNISKKLGRDIGFCILMTIFPFVMLPLIGLSDNYKWDDSVVVSNNGPFNNSGDTDNIDVVCNNGVSFCSNCGNRLNNCDKFCGNCGRKL